MNPHSKHRPLFFTPRSPWGGRLESQSFHRHMRASQDKNSDPASKNSQGLTGQKAPYDPKTVKADQDIVRQPGYVAPSVKEQMQKDIDWNLKQGYASDRDLTLQQKYERDNLMRDTFPSDSAQPDANAARPKWGVSGEINYGRTRPKDGPTDFSVQAKVTYGREEQQKKLEAEKLKYQKSTNGTGEEPDVNPAR